MKTILSMVVLSLLGQSVWADGTIQFLNTSLSKIKIQMVAGGPVEDAPIGALVQLYAGSTLGTIRPVLPALAVTTPGLFYGGVVFSIPETVAGQNAFLRIEATYAAPDGTRYFGETRIIQCPSLGPTNGPGAVVWQSPFGASESRMLPFTMGLADRQPQSIDFEALPTKDYGDPPFALNATASSGLPVVYRSTDPSVATVNGNLVTIVGGGTAAIVASQPGNDVYRAAPDFLRTLVVSSPPAEIVLEDLIQVFTGSPLTPSARTVPPGLPVVFTFNGSSTAPSQAGTYELIATIISRHYSGSTEATFTIQKAPQSIVFDQPAPALLGGELVFLVAVASSGLPVTFTSSNPSVASINGTVAVPHAVGRATITASQRGNANYLPASDVSLVLSVDVQVELETINIGGVTRTAPVGTPAVLVNGVFIVDSNVVVRGPPEIMLSSTYPDNHILYSLNGSEPELDAGIYEGPFRLPRTATIRARAYDGSFTHSALADPVTVRILPEVTADNPGGGGVAIDPPSGGYLPGDLARVTATAWPGWQFLRWLGDATGTNSVATLHMNRPRLVTAIFGTALGTSVVGSGSLEKIPASALYPYEATVRLMAIPSPGSYFALWAGSGTGTNNPLSFLINEPNRNVMAVFATLPAGSHALTVTPDGFGRVEQRPRGNRFPSGTNVTLTAVPAEGQVFLGWSGDASGSLSPLVVSMTQSRQITARFTARPKLTVLNWGGTAPGEDVQIKVTGDYGGAYGVESRTLVPGSAWIERGVVQTPWGLGQFNEAVVAGPPPRAYRAVRK